MGRRNRRYRRLPGQQHPALEAVRLTRRVGVGRRRFAQQTAQVDEVLLRGRALLQLGGPPLRSALALGRDGGDQGLADLTCGAHRQAAATGPGDHRQPRRPSLRWVSSERTLWRELIARPLLRAGLIEAMDAAEVVGPSASPGRHLVPITGHYGTLGARSASSAVARASRTWAAGAPTARATARATTDHRGGLRRDGRDSGHFEQVRTSRSALSGRRRAAHLWATVRSLKGFRVMAKTCPERSQAW